MSRSIRKFVDETRGAILVFWAFALVAVFGLVAVSLDVGRIASSHSEFQSFADQVALAAAGELDGNADAISRATAAASAMATRSQTYADGANSLGAVDYALTFLKSLPSQDYNAASGEEYAIGTGNQAAGAADAQYVMATVTPRNIGLSFARVLFSLLGRPIPTAATRAYAVAGFTQYACDITPMMFCLPNAGYKADDNVGKLVTLRSGGQGSAWQPGDFGFLDPKSSSIAADPGGPCAGLNGNNLFQCLLAGEGSLTQCFSKRGVNVEPGQKNGIENAIWNVRFDIFESSMQHDKTALYPAAPNVIKGIVPKSKGGGSSGGGSKGGGNACIGTSGGDPSPDTMAMPLDDDTASNRFGSGSWDKAGYLAMNWPGGAPGGWTGATRWSLYNAEIAAGGTGDILTGKAETGRPACTSHQSVYAERRMIIAAGIDCDANTFSGSATNVPVQEFFKLFLTRPVDQDGSKPPNVSIYAEIIGSAQGVGGAGGKGGLFHDVVQLYR